jgi:hypothetical protein
MKQQESIGNRSICIVDPRSQKQLVEHGQGEPEHCAALQGSTLKEMSNDAKGEDMPQDKNKPKESGRVYNHAYTVLYCRT